MDTINFKEEQRFRVWWAWLGVIALNGLFLFAIVKQVVLGQPFGTSPAPDYVLVLIGVFLLLILFFLQSIKLKTRITDQGIYYRFYPFQFKETEIEWHELRDVYVRQYNSFLEYGGWGIRYGSPKVGQAVNTSASSGKGLQLQFNNGKLLLIGTAKPEEIALVLHQIMTSGKINRHI